MAIPICRLSLRCNLDWLTQFHDFSWHHCKLPQWVIWVTDIASWVSYTVLQYRDKRYVHCVYSITIRVICGIGDMQISTYFACSPGRPLLEMALASKLFSTFIHCQNKTRKHNIMKIKVLKRRSSLVLISKQDKYSIT